MVVRALLGDRPAGLTPQQPLAPAQASERAGGDGGRYPAPAGAAAARACPAPVADEALTGAVDPFYFRRWAPVFRALGLFGQPGRPCAGSFWPGSRVAVAPQRDEVRCGKAARSAGPADGSGGVPPAGAWLQVLAPPRAPAAPRLPGTSKLASSPAIRRDGSPAARHTVVSAKPERVERATVTDSACGMAGLPSCQSRWLACALPDRDDLGAEVWHCPRLSALSACPRPVGAEALWHCGGPLPLRRGNPAF